MSLISRSPSLDGLLFAGALLIVGAGFGAAFWRQVRAMRATPTHQGARPIQGDERIGGPMASMEDDDPPLPPDPVPVDGGLVVLALAGGAYGMRQLHTTDDLS